jgi:hypothetical protein
MDKSLRSLADRQAITDALYRYCRSVDRLDVPLGRSVFHEDGWADYGPDVYQGPARDVIDLICAQHARTLVHSHQISNIVIALDGDRAGSEAYCTATLRIERDGQMRQMTVWSRYVDAWERRDGTWAIARRQAIRDFDEIRTVTEMYRHDVGRRDASDPSYGLLGSLV